MLLGLSAVAVAMAYALVKFITAMHMRRLRDNRVRLHYDVKRSRQRLESLEGKLQVERSNKGSILQKAQTARRFKEEEYARLRIELPDALQADLRKCINRNPVPESRGVRLFRDLQLSDRIAAALEAVSIVVFECAGPDSGAEAVLKGLLLQLCDVESIPYAIAERRDEEDTERIVATFDNPDAAMAFCRRLPGAAPEEHLHQLQGVLMAAANTGDEDQEDLRRVYARSLDLAQNMADTAPLGSLLINEAAYRSLTDRGGIEEFSKVEHLYSWAWQEGPAPYPSAEASPREGEPTADSSPGENGRDGDEEPKADGDSSDHGEGTRGEAAAPSGGPAGKGAHQQKGGGS